MYIVVNHRGQPVNNRIFFTPLDAADEVRRLQRLYYGRTFEIAQVAPDGDNEL